MTDKELFKKIKVWLYTIPYDVDIDSEMMNQINLRIGDEVEPKTDKEKFIQFWSPTIGLEEAEKSWEEKLKESVKKSHMIASDIGGYISQIDGSWIESRSKHRDHLKRHGMVELGNDVPMKQKQVEIQDNRVRKERIAQQVYEKLRYK